MKQDAIDEERREQKIYQELLNLSEEESDKDLYKEMDTLREDLEQDEKSEFFRRLEGIEHDSNVDASANSEEPIMNEVSSEEHGTDEMAHESAGQSRNIERPEPCDERKSSKEFIAKHWILLIGIALVAIGMFGVIGLRLNTVQIFLLSIDNPFPGIGSMEPMGHIGAIIPFAIGIVAIIVWGFRSDKGDESKEKSESAEKEDTPNIKPTEPTENVGAAVSYTMGIINLFVWGFILDKSDAVEKSEGDAIHTREQIP